MTTWSVVNDETREKRWQDHFPRSLPRYVLLVCLALVVVSLGVVLMPARPPEPAEPPFSEQARAAALAETLQLLDAGSQLGPAKQHGPKDSSTESADSADGELDALGDDFADSIKELFAVGTGAGLYTVGVGGLLGAAGAGMALRRTA